MENLFRDIYEIRFYLGQGVDPLALIAQIVHHIHFYLKKVKQFIYHILRVSIVYTKENFIDAFNIMSLTCKFSKTLRKYSSGSIASPKND